MSALLHILQYIFERTLYFSYTPKQCLIHFLLQFIFLIFSFEIEIFPIALHSNSGL